MRYKNIEKNKRNGVVYTPKDMANYVSELMLNYKVSITKNDTIEILDPAVGEGELLVSMVNSLKNKVIKKIKIVGYETDKEVANRTQRILGILFPDIEIDIRVGDFLLEVEQGNIEKFDYVIANPPYIRTQILGSDRAQVIAEKLKLNGRIDIYYAFLLYTKLVLKDTGVAGYITSNKFMTIKSGQSVREYMLDNYSIYHVVDLGDTKLFTASVLPCILIFSLGKTINKSDVNFTTVYEDESGKNFKITKNIFDVIKEKGFFELENGKKYKIQQGKIRSIDNKEIWGIATNEDNDFLNNVEKNTWLTFSDLGKIRVGIKTTADNVFIGDDWESRGQNIELLKPLITHRNAGQIFSNNDIHWKVLYTHYMNEGKKSAINLEEYPNSKLYLEQHYEQLSARKYLQKAKRNWFEIWVPQNPAAWQDKKIVFRDISEKPQFWIDESGAIVNGDCYWIDIKSTIDTDLLYLALAVANSSFIEKYYDIKFNNKLYSGKRRFQSQYVEQFPIPYYISAEAEEVIALVKKIIAERNFTNSDKEKMDKLVFSMFSY